MPQRESVSYTMTSDLIKEPPAGFWNSLRFLGPSLILTASIVGSGELIATTTLGAQAGFVTFWVIIVSCLCKVALQLEFGRQAIVSGKPTFISFLDLPGPVWKGGHWIMWVWHVLMITKFIQLGGILGGIALIFRIVFPGIPLQVWIWLSVILCALLIGRGMYDTVEIVSVVLIGLFSLTTVLCVLFLQYTPYAITGADLLSGLSFKLPVSAIGVAIAAFGLTGVGGTEIMQYPYWCIEKGYAAYTGPRSESPEWVRRAKGWIRVMYIDSLISLVVYTVVTAAFYLLGAAVLHNRGEIPKGYAMVETLSGMYTNTLGPWAMYIFLLGAFVVLFSTFFAVIASWSRQYADAFGCVGWLDYFNEEKRRRFLILYAWIAPVFMALFFIFMKNPVLMVVFGGIGTAAILLFVLFAAYWYRYRLLDKRLIPSRWYDAVLWLSMTVILILAVRGLYLGLLGYAE